MPDFRRGAAEVEKAKQGKGKKSFGVFAPSIFWKSDKEEKYLWLITTVDAMPRVDVIKMIELEHERSDGTTWSSYEDVLARTDPAISEQGYKKDPLNDEFDGRIQDSNLIVAIELEPEVTENRGRSRPVSFTVKTQEFERRIRDEDGELTDETETVVAPVWGFILQAATNFGAALTAFDESEAPMHEVPIKIQRLGKDRNTQYVVTGYPELVEKTDLTGFFDNINGISYLGDDEEEALNLVPEVIGDLTFEEIAEVASNIGDILLERRLNELADEERYQRIYDSVAEKGETLDIFGSKDKKKSQKTAAKPATKRETQRKTEKPATKQNSDDALKALQTMQAKAAERTKAKA